MADINKSWGAKTLTAGSVKLYVESSRLGSLPEERKIGRATTLKQLLQELVTTHPKVVRLIFDIETQQLTGLMAVVVNGSLVQSSKALEMRLNDGDVVGFVDVISGG